MKKTALITGASGGIGSAIAKKFAKNGYAVVLLYNRHPESIRKITDCMDDGAACLCIKCDITDAESVNEIVRMTHERIGSIGVLINCAGTALKQNLLTDTTDEDYMRVFETNVHGMIRVTRAFYDDIRINQGAIVNMSSVWGVTGASCEVLYSASKAAVIGFTQALAKELAPSGATVNCIAPGWIPTQMNAHLSEQASSAFIQNTPLGRLGTPEEIADAAWYLANARFVTGQTVRCDGGYTI